MNPVNGDFVGAAPTALNHTSIENVGILGLGPDSDIRVLSGAVSAMAARFGVTVPAPNEQALAEFAALPGERRAFIRETLWTTLQLSAELPETAPDYEITIDDEVKLIRKFLSRRRWRLGDPEAFSYVTDEDFIEVYTLTGIQLYRSWSFFSFCGYSLLELLVYDWNTLYERPAWVAEELFKLAPKLFEPGSKTFSYGICEHALTERYLDHNRIFTVRMKYASPLIDEDSGQVTGFLSTAAADVVAEGPASKKLSFI